MSDSASGGAARLDGADAARAKPKKAPNAFRTISEVADELRISRSMCCASGKPSSRW